MSTAASFGSMVSDAVPCHGQVCCGHLSEDRDTKPSRGAVEPRYATFGSFVPLAMLCYGCQQNFAKASTEFACKYYMMDELKLDGVTIGRRAITRRKPKNFEKKNGACIWMHLASIFVHHILEAERSEGTNIQAPQVHDSCTCSMEY